MGFIRENITKIFVFLVVLVIFIIIFSFVFGRGSKTKEVSYASMENSLLNAAIKYANDNQKLIPKKEEETNKINLDTLTDAKYISELKAIEDSNIKCNGYVQLLYKNNRNVYVPYLKCGKYYETKSLANYIIDNEPKITSGDGLYAYNDKYIFKGENPKNYVQMGDKLYRIIELEETGEIRLISVSRIGAYVIWDDRYNPSKDSNVGITDYSKSRLKDYFEAIINNNSTNPEDENYYFSSQEIDKIVSHDICIGKRPSTYADINSNNECQVIERDQKISLLTVSDYARASVDGNCRTIYDKSCANYNYFSSINDTFRTITAVSENTYQIFVIDSGRAEFTKASNTFRPNIVVYIDNLSLYNSGDGSYENPYTIR